MVFSVFVCVYKVYACVRMHVPAQAHKEARGVPVLLSYSPRYFSRQRFSLSLGLTAWLTWLTNKLQESNWLPSSPQCWGCEHAQPCLVLCSFWESQFRSSCFSGKHFTRSATSPLLLYGLIVKKWAEWPFSSGHPSYFPDLVKCCDEQLPWCLFSCQIKRRKKMQKIFLCGIKTKLGGEILT